MTTVSNVVSNVVTPVTSPVASLSPILHMPLINSVNVAIGVGTATFTSASTRSYVDRDDGLIKTVSANVARFEAEGYLVESDGTNLQTKSEELDHSDWTKSELTVSADNAVAPDGNTTMDLMIPSANDTAHTFVQLESVTSGTDYVQSVYVNSGGYDFIQITGSTGFASEWVNFDLTDGTVGDSSISTGTTAIKDMGGGIYRCSLSLPATSTTTGGMLVAVYSTDVASRLATFTGDASSGVNGWGAQFETGTSPSSYIATTAAPVTRLADNLSIDSDNIPAPTADYSISFEFDYREAKTGEVPFLFSVVGETTRRIITNNSNLLKFNHVTNADSSSTLDSATHSMVGVRAAGVHTLYIDGVQDDTATPGTVTGTKTSIQIGRDGTTQTRYLNGHIKNLKIFDKALTASEVSTL